MKTLTTLSVTALLALSACAKNKGAVVLTPEPAEPTVVVRTVEVPVVLDAEQQTTRTTMQGNFERVHFAFDQSDLNEESRMALMDNVQIMKENPEVTIEVQGHADERGTDDYNLALGQRRATSVEQFMVAQGIDGSRIRTVSYGEERPLTEADNPSAYSKNRRAEFRVLFGEQRVAGTVAPN